MLTHFAQNDKSAVIARFANLKRAFARHYQTKHKNTSNRHCEQGTSLARQSTNSKTSLFKPLLYDKTKPNPFQSLTLRQNKTQPTLFAKKCLHFQGFMPWNFKWTDLNLAAKAKVALWANRTKFLISSFVRGGRRCKSFETWFFLT